MSGEQLTHFNEGRGIGCDDLLGSGPRGFLFSQSFASRELFRRPVWYLQVVMFRNEVAGMRAALLYNLSEVREQLELYSLVRDTNQEDAQSPTTC